MPTPSAQALPLSHPYQGDEVQVAHPVSYFCCGFFGLSNNEESKKEQTVHQILQTEGELKTAHDELNRHLISLSSDVSHVRIREKIDTEKIKGLIRNYIYDMSTHSWNIAQQVKRSEKFSNDIEHALGIHKRKKELKTKRLNHYISDSNIINPILVAISVCIIASNTAPTVSASFLLLAGASGFAACLVVMILGMCIYNHYKSNEAMEKHDTLLTKLNELKEKFVPFVETTKTTFPPHNPQTGNTP